jgi:hypothetical protein
MKTHINLLPPAYRKSQLTRRLLVAWSFVWAICAAAGLVACVFAYRENLVLRDEAIAVERSVAPVRRLLDENAVMQGSLKELEAKSRVFGELQSERPMLSLVGAVSESASRCEGRLVVEYLRFERRQERETETAKTPPADASQKPPAQKDAAWGQVTIRGDALDNLAVATFVVGLRESGLFRRVELKSCIRSPGGGADIRSYVMECDI